MLSSSLTFLQSSFSFHCSPDHFAILRSILCEDTFDPPAAVAAQPEQQLVAQLAAQLAAVEAFARQVR